VKISFGRRCLISETYRMGGLSSMRRSAHRSGSRHEWGKVPGTKFDNYIRFKKSGAYDRVSGLYVQGALYHDHRKPVEALQRTVRSDDIWFGTMLSS